MQSPSRVFARIVLGIYNILSTYLLGWVLFLSCLAFGFHLLTEAIVANFGFERADQWWAYVEWRLDVDALVLRFPIYVGLQAAIIYFGRGLLATGQARLEAVFDSTVKRFRALTDGRPRLYLISRAIFTLGVTVVLIPFIVQPTLVGTSMTSSDWIQRTANLADGTASRNVVDSVVGTYRRHIVGDVESVGGVDDDDLSWEPPFEEAPDDESDEIDDVDSDESTDTIAPPAPSGTEPLMDRWDPTIRSATDGDPKKFAFVKAFMRVESSGRQFAVSRTGCAGLMQFCSGTARRQPFRRIFGAGSIYTCGCHPNCNTPREVSRGLETGNRSDINDLEDQFPCDLTDSRFDGTKSIRAGTRYIEDLAASYGQNLYLMYIGYNSGPGVANTVWRKLGRNSDADLDDIRPHLTDALRPHFHGASARRARSLLNTHLPRLRRSFDAYHETDPVAGVSTIPQMTAQKCAPSRNL